MPLPRSRAQEHGKFIIVVLDVLTSDSSIIILINKFYFVNPNRNREETWNLLDRRPTTAGVGFGRPGLRVGKLEDPG